MKKMAFLALLIAGLLLFGQLAANTYDSGNTVGGLILSVGLASILFFALAFVLRLTGR